MKNFVFSLLLIVTLVLPKILADCDCYNKNEAGSDVKAEALKLKIAAIAGIFLAGGMGVFCPILGNIFPRFSPGNDLFFIVKAFAAGVVFATACVHVLPDAFENLTSPCLSDQPWGSFPFGGVGLMGAAIATMLLEQFANILYQRIYSVKAEAAIPVVDIAEAEHIGQEGQALVQMHATQGHAHGAAFAAAIPVGEIVEEVVNVGDLQELVQTHGHAHGPAIAANGSVQLRQDRIIAQVLEIGIMVHSVIIGISLGASQNSKTIKPLIAALCFHQFFEGMSLGGCISQAKFNALKAMLMSLFFTLTTPVGVAIGIAISTSYNENSPTALITEGLLNSASSGILVYMALVDLIQETFKGLVMLNNPKLLLGCDFALLLGLGCMTLLAKWA